MPSPTVERQPYTSSRSRSKPVVPRWFLPVVGQTMVFGAGARLYSTKRSAEDVLKPSRSLTHLTPTGAAHIVHLPPPFDPSIESAATSKTTSNTKPPTSRRAIARALVHFSNPTATGQIRTASLKKGDVLSVARIAGIMAAKRTPELVPLCHNILISGAEVDMAVIGGSNGEQPVEEQVLYKSENVGEHGAVVVTATVHTFGQTGVEMEALTAASTAALTVYDMCKAVDKGMRIDGLRVVLKEGGRSGTWSEDGAPKLD